MAGSVLDIPGLREAVAKERLVREAAFLPLTESVGGFELVPMCLWHFITLRLMKSPLLFGGVPSPEELAAFLWLLSPNYLPGRGWKATRRRMKLSRKVQTCYALDSLLHDAQRYVTESLQDWQPSSGPDGIVQTEHYSDGVAICAAMAREYHGWSEAAVMAMPMKRVLQYLKEIRVFNGSRVPLCNPSDSVKAEWLESVNQRN